ncbi:hypothetical protein HPP92_007053 [Vanilla planifolia]|uniref:Uncharacterized protein n=1 Tax=Vanilla planifolia TaxID=51239 RepID=A0A835RDD8_VANPL|nr:hypothetical protein HPP92_007053 [Vanilla planifolia]
MGLGARELGPWPVLSTGTPDMTRERQHAWEDVVVGDRAGNIYLCFRSNDMRKSEIGQWRRRRTMLSPIGRSSVMYMGNRAVEPECR